MAKQYGRGRILLGSLFFLFSLISSIEAQKVSDSENLVFNPGFEDGSIGWIQHDNKTPISLENKIVYSGKFSAIVKGNYDGLKQTREKAIPVEQGTTYLITAKGYSDDGVITITCAEMDKNKSWLGRNILIAKTTKKREWEEIQGLYIPSDEKVGYILIDVISDKGGFVDDINVVRKEKTENLVLNASFEDGTLGWILADNLTPPHLIEGVFHTGQRAIVLNPGELVKNKFLIPVEKDKKYKVSAWVLIQSAGHANLRVQAFDENRIWLKEEMVSIGTTSEIGWSMISGEYTPPAKASFVAIELIGDTTIVIDDIFFSEITKQTLQNGQEKTNVLLVPKKYLFYEDEKLEATLVVTIPQKFYGLPQKLHSGEESGLSCIYCDIKINLIGTQQTFCIWEDRIPFFEGRNEIDIVVPYKEDYGIDSYLLVGELYAEDLKISEGKVKIGLMGKRPPQLTRINYTNYPEPIYRIGMVNRQISGKREFVEQDFYTIKRLGFDIVELDLYWSDLEPVEGNFTWKRLDTFINYAEKNDLKVAIKVVMWDLPSWITERMVSDRGDIGMCPPNWGRIAEEKLPRLWQKIAERYANNPAVVLYYPHMGLQDGPIHGDFDKALGPAQYYDYSDESQKAWRRFLKEEKQLTLEKVSTLMNKKFSSWEEVYQPKSFEYKGEKYREEIWKLFVEFQAYGVTKVFERLFRAIRSVDEKTPVEIRIGGGADEWLIKGFDFTSLIPLCKKYNGILVQTNSNPDKQVACLGSLSQSFELPFTTEVGAPPNSVQVVRSILNSIKAGARAHFYCFWQAGRPTDDWAYLKPLWKNIFGGKRIEDNLVLLHAAQLPSYDSNLLQRVRDKGNFFSFFSNLNYQYKVIMLPCQETMENLAKKNIILFDTDSLWIDKEWQDQLDGYLKNEGTLVLNYLTDSQNGYRYQKKILPGLKIDEIASKQNLIYHLAKGNDSILSEIKGIKFIIPSAYKENIKILAEWQDGSCAAFSYQIPGQGKIFFIGFPLIDLVPYKGNTGKTILEDIFGHIGLKRNITPSVYGVQAIIFKTEEDNYKLLFYNGFNYPVNSEFSIDFLKKRKNAKILNPNSLLLIKDLFR